MVLCDGPPPAAEVLAFLHLPGRDGGESPGIVRAAVGGGAVVGLFVVAPFIFFKIYGFVLPGLYKRERRVITPLLLATTGLFYAGVVFAFLVVVLFYVEIVVFVHVGVGRLSSWIPRVPLVGFGSVFIFIFNCPY